MAWRVGDGPKRAGRVELDGDQLVLGDLVVDRAAIESVRLARDVLFVDRHGADAVRIESLDRPGTLRELADLL